MFLLELLLDLVGSWVAPERGPVRSPALWVVVLLLIAAGAIYYFRRQS